MSKKGLALLAQAVTVRLDKIAFHFKERERLKIELNDFTIKDFDNNAPSNEDLKRSVCRCINEEINALYELVHLYDNITSLINKSKGDILEIKEFAKDPDFRMAANFVNSHKHGPRGKNQKSAYIAFHQEIFIAAKDGSGADRLLQIKPVINFDGTLKTTDEIIRKLISCWIIFTRKHTEISIANLESEFNVFLEKRKRAFNLRDRNPCHR